MLPIQNTFKPSKYPGTYLVKLARFCVTLAMRVSVRAVRSSGYSCMRSKSDGDMMAGQRKRRKSEALISRSLISGLPRLLHSCLQDANTSFSSRGNTLQGQSISLLIYSFLVELFNQMARYQLFSILVCRTADKKKTVNLILADKTVKIRFCVCYFQS